MTSRISIAFATLFLLICSGVPIVAQQETPPQDDIRKQIGTIIVTPGNGPNLAVADFVARSAGLEAAAATFNQVLWADLDFAAVSGLVGKSLYPKTIIPDPASLKFDEWSGDPVKADYVAFGNLKNTGGPNIVVRSAEGGLIGGTSFTSTTTSPTISPSGQLAFSSAISGDGSMEIYVSNLDGSNARRLTRTPKGINISPRWNPKTGREIAYISSRGGSPQVYVMDASGANQRPLVARGGHADSPSWSPDGRYIAFTYGGAGSFQIFVADVASGQLVQLTSQGRNESPTWAPDSRHIAYQSSRTGRWEIWQMHVDGSNQRQVTHGGGRLPSWAK